MPASTEWLTKDQVIVHFPFLTVRHLQTLRTKGELAFYLIRGRVVYDAQDIETWLQSCRAERARGRVAS
jgi:hypothetical protein